jgi:cytochrome c peroxidase
MNKKILISFVAFVSCMIFSSGILVQKSDIGATAAIAYFRDHASAFSATTGQLVEAIKRIDADTTSVIKARTALLKCRLSYKQLSFFSNYFFPSETAMYNGAPRYEVEEPELELVEPMGLQQLEALLYEKNVQDKQEELVIQAQALHTSAADLGTLLYGFHASDEQVLESLRIELIRIMSLYIAGYDAPLLKSGIAEAEESMRSMQMVLAPYLKSKLADGQSLAKTLASGIEYLHKHPDFDGFDRMQFLVDHALPLQQQLGSFIQQIGLELNTTAYLNYRADHLFSTNFLGNFDTIPPQKRKQLAQMGEKLFFDPRLSGNAMVSCSSCHQPENYFADGKKISASLDQAHPLKRNTPSLHYASYQHSQFWDGRAKTMTEQIKQVLFSPTEMGGHQPVLLKYVMDNAAYRAHVDRLFSGTHTGDEDMDHIALALAAYVSALNPMNSPFDQYIAGNQKAMNATQIKGFNLFMGKAQCGSCHFAPLFNALVPPFYDRSELEVLGTPKTDDLSHPAADVDLGRFDLYHIRYYKQAFKTPTVRNAEKTAPYMHNGAFSSLESVIEFYNKGGANGLGLATPDQTLASKPLNLTKPEINAIIQFINSLTDQTK